MFNTRQERYHPPHPPPPRDDHKRASATRWTKLKFKSWTPIFATFIFQICNPSTGSQMAHLKISNPSKGGVSATCLALNYHANKKQISKTWSEALIMHFHSEHHVCASAVLKENGTPKEWSRIWRGSQVTFFQINRMEAEWGSYQQLVNSRSKPFWNGLRSSTRLSSSFPTKISCVLFKDFLPPRLYCNRDPWGVESKSPEVPACIASCEIRS